MEVEHTKSLGAGYEIEIGKSTWHQNDRSIRYRCPTKNGGFSPRSSSELPMEALPLLVKEAAAQDELTKEVLVTMITELAASLQRLI